MRGTKKAGTSSRRDIDILPSENKRKQQPVNEGLSVLYGHHAEYPHVALPVIISAVAKQTPDRVALEFRDEKITYKQLDEKANEVAVNLVNAGVKTGDIVALMVDRSQLTLISLLGILKAGGVYLPLDPEHPDDRIEFTLSDSGAELLLTCERHQERFKKQINQLLVDKLPDAPTANIPLPKVAADDFAYILYTSGSTGKPKGVKIRHRNLVNLLTSMCNFPGINSDDRLLAVTTVTFDIAGLELFLPLTVGATVVLADSNTTRDGRALLEMMKSKNITMMQATPATWKLLIASGWSEKLAVKVLCCGEPLPKDLAEKLLDRCGELWNMYGPTETTIYSTGKRILKSDNVITIGIPINNTQIYILDHNQKPVPPGEIGEIYIGGDGVAGGYYNRPQHSAEKFTKDTFKEDDDWMYASGDLGQLTKTGEILCLGRVDQQIKIRGYRIEPGEIEYQLKHCDGVKEAMVTTRREKGDEFKLVAYLLLGEASLVQNFKNGILAAIKEELKKNLPFYMVPAEFHLVDHVPLTLSCKVDYKALPSAVKDPVPSEALQEYTSELEKQLHRIWADALETDDFDVDDNFFDIGGHSLIAVYVMAEIESQIGKTLPISTFYEYPTIRKLASLLQTDIGENLWNSLVPIRPNGKKTPLYLVHGDGLNILVFNQLAQQLDPEQPLFGLQAIGLNRPDAPIGTMEQIATQYVREILQQNPEGPYAIAGYSYGGNIGLEMARILKGMGKRVTVLAMFDANAQNSEKHRAMLPKITDKVLRQFPKMWWIARSFVKTPAEAFSYQLDYLKKRARKFAAKLGLYKEPEPDKAFEKIDSLQHKYIYAYENYEIKPYDGAIHLFKAKKRIYFIEDPEKLGWEKYALKGLKIYEIPGDHKTMLQPPNVNVLAQLLQQVLDQN